MVFINEVKMQLDTGESLLVISEEICKELGDTKNDLQQQNLYW